MLTLIIPTYKEAQNIDILLPNIFDKLQSQIDNLKIIIVDDDSQDGLEEIVSKTNKRYGNNTKLIVRKENKGLASAWKKGIEESSTELIGIIDADLVHSPEDILKLYQQFRSNNAQMIIGSRYLPNQSSRMKGKSLIAANLSILAQKFGQLFLKINICDMSHSFRLFSKDVYNQAAPYLESSGNSMMIEFTFYTSRLGFKIKEFPITYGKRKYGQTKLSIFKEGSIFLSVLFRLSRAKIGRQQK